MTKTSDFIFELGTEELPPKSLKKLSRALLEAVSQALKTERVDFAAIEAFATPRRLAILIKNLAKEQPAQVITKKGPSLKIALNSQGEPTPAGLGFAKSVGVNFQELDRVENNQDTWIVFSQNIPGKPVKEILPKIFVTALSQLPIAKAMRWSDKAFSFIRPVHWILSLLDDEVLNIEALGIKSEGVSYGHRFHANHPLKLKTATDYESVLEKAYVIPSFEKRKSLIYEAILEKASTSSLNALIDPDLLEEVTALVEWPVALKGKFDAEYLSVPKECLISSMETNQKYFSLVHEDGALANEFIFIANIHSKEPSAVIEGNERVIRPRLADAKFFYNVDQQQTLSQYRQQLKNVILQKKLGTLWDKSERLIHLSQFIAKNLDLQLPHLKGAAQLCKADLVTQMVTEFPHLQGVMGQYYAKAEHQDADLCLAIEEHYLPRFQGDKIPETKTGICLSLADKIDTLVGILGIGKTPTGDKDPYGLRRATLGIIRICIEQNIDIDLADCMKKAIEGYAPGVIQENTLPSAIDFSIGRFRSWYHSQEIPTPIVQSVEALKISNPLDFDRRVKAVLDFSKQPSADSLAAANKRVRNILKKNKVAAREPDKSLFNAHEEIELANALSETENRLITLIRDKDYMSALKDLALIKPQVDAFFDKITIMTDDEEIKMNRLQLLKKLNHIFLSISDISYLSAQN